MGAMRVMALALSVVGGAIGAGLGVGALSGMWGIPAVVAVATVGVVTVGVVGGGAGGGRGSVAACSAPADSACAPAAAGVPVVIPVVNDWPNDCGDNGAVAAAAAVSAAVYVGSAVVPAAVAGPLFVGRVSATIKAAAPSTTAAIATLATAANGQLRERGGAGGWVGVHCPVVGGGGVGHPRKAIAAAVSVHSTCMPAAFGGHLGLGDRSRSVSLSGTP
ncbi:transmembrane protein [Mycobacterium tuberculosis]|nr:transmembrane protein [Mycobacterium tuberculosis]CMG63629.1 transmembrane protein [Mycobacterium tuberculosis]